MIDRSNIEFLADYKAELFSRWRVLAKPGEMVSYYDGVLKHPSQKKMHFSEDTLVPGRRTIAHAGQRSGKTIWLAAEEWAQLGIPGTQLWHCAPTYKLCGKAWAYIWDAVVNQRCLGNFIDRAVDSKDEREIRLKWGDKPDQVSWIRAVSTDPGKGYQQLKGDQLDGVGWDECADEPEQIPKRYLMPRLVNRNGWFAAISEPAAFNWFWEYGKRASDPAFYADGWRTFNFAMGDNPFIEPETIEKLRRTLSVEEAARVIDGQFSSLAGQIWPGYRDELYPAGHLYDPDLKDSALPHGFDPLDGTRFRIIDIGLDHPTACLWIAVARENNDRYIYHDYEERLDTHREHAHQISAETKYPIALSLTGQDAKRRSGLTKELKNISPLDIYRQAGIYCRTTKDDAGSNSAGISAIGQMFGNTREDHPDGPRIFISRHCLKTRDAILRATYKRTGVESDQPTEVPSKYKDDIAEALRRSGKVNLTWRPPVTHAEVEDINKHRRVGGRRGFKGRATVPRV